MPSERPENVRPTRRCLDDLGVAVPNLGVALSDLEHPLVRKAQRLPAEENAGRAETIKSLTDRRWYKVKVSSWRGAGGSLGGELPDVTAGPLAQFHQWWWLVAAGERQDDSPQNDFYAGLAREAHAGGPHTCSTDHLLPTVWDLNRLVAEAGVFAQRALRATIRRAARESLRTSTAYGFSVGDAQVRLRIRMHHDGQVYLAVGATAIIDPGFFAAVFSSLPGVTKEDWIPEPGGALDIEPAPGEVLWSALLSPEAQRLLMED